MRIKSAADDVTVTIKDASGAVVRTIDAGAATADVHFVDWDGKGDNGKSLADGTYTFAVTASEGKTAVDTTALTRRPRQRAHPRHERRPAATRPARQHRAFASRRNSLRSHP